MSDNKPEHPGIVLTHQYLEALRVPMRFVAKTTEIELDVLNAFFKGAADLNRAQAEAMQKVLNQWRNADWIIGQQDAAAKCDGQDLG